MLNKRGAVKYWGLVLGWILMIFIGSTDAGSSHNTSRIIGPILKWLYPGIAESQLDTIIFLIRKAAHVTEYAILASLAWCAFRRSIPEEGWSWKFSVARNAWLLATVNACLDEFHQSFVGSRTGQWQDSAIDAFGAFLGLCVIGLFRFWLERRRSAALAS